MPQSRMTEAELQAAILQLCKLYGLHAYHTKFSIRSAPGWPDLAICGRKLIFRELKSGTGQATAAQVAWGERLAGAGQDWALWRPEDLRSGRIQHELEAIR